MSNPCGASELEAVANEALRTTAELHADLKASLADESQPCASAEKIEQWRLMVVRTNKAVSQLARLAWIADDRRNIEMSILLESVKRDALDREATFAHTWGKLRQQTTNLSGDNPSVSVDRALSAATQVESALAALAPVPNTNFPGAPDLALLLQ